MKALRAVSFANRLVHERGAKVGITGIRQIIREGSRDARDEKYERQEPGAGETARLRARDAGAAEARPRSTHGPRCARSGTARGVPPRDRLSRASQNQIFPRKRDGAFPWWGQTTQLSSRGSRTAASLGTARAARRKRTRPRRSRGARWVWERCRSERAKTSMVTTARLRNSQHPDCRVMSAGIQSHPNL